MVNYYHDGVSGGGLVVVDDHDGDMVMMNA